MFRKIQNKIIILLTLLSLIMIVGLYLLRTSDENKIKMLLSERQREYAILLDKVIDLKSKGLQTLAFEYTYWDEMVDFVKSGNKKWADATIVNALPTYNAQAVWVYKQNLSLMYSANSLNATNLLDSWITKDVLKQIVSKASFYHFFILTDYGLMEISGASIHPGVDIERKTPQQGYFFVGRLWTDTYLDELSSFLGSNVHLLPLGDDSLHKKEEESKEFVVKNVKVLNGWDGSPIINVCSINEATIAKVLGVQTDTQFTISIIFLIVIIFSISFILFLLVNRPLNIISQSLATSDPNIIKDLQNEKNEFGNLANLVADFFNQKEKLINEISERTKVEEALRQSEKKLREIVEHSTNLFYSHTPDHVLTYVSPQSRTFFDCEPEEAIVKWTEFVTDNPINQEGYIMTQRAIETGRTQLQYELELLSKKGRKIWVEVHESPVVVNGRTVAIVGSLTNITEKKIAEEALKQSEERIRQSQKMESIGTLAGGVAHDFNNLLAIIMGHASLLEMIKDKPQKVIQSAEVIKKAVDRGAGLVNQILTFARKTDIRMESVNVKNVIQDLVNLLQQTFSKTIKIVTEFGKNIPPITADHNQIHQALLNISVNARDAMPHGGTLSFTTNVVNKKELKHFFSEASELLYVCVSIKDTGSGIDEQTRKRIYEPFFTTKDFGKGTGLGLATVYGIMHGHRGFIDVDSKIDIGTTFHLYFPLNPEETKIERRTQETEVEIKGGTETLLVVEDEEMLLELLTKILVGKGYNVLSARDGLEGIDVYAAHKDEITLILTDMGLPKLSGFDMFMKLKKINPDILAIFASGFLEPSMISEAYKAGAKEFVQKPYEPNNVLKKIRTVIDIYGDASTNKSA